MSETTNSTADWVLCEVLCQFLLLIYELVAQKCKGRKTTQFADSHEYSNTVIVNSYNKKEGTMVEN